MLKQLALVTLAATALVASPSLGHALIAANGIMPNGVNVNGQYNNGITLNGQYNNGVNVNGQNLNGQNLNGQNLNGVNVNGQNLNGVEPAGREVYFVDEQASGEGSTVLTIELPRVEPRIPALRLERPGWRSAPAFAWPPHIGRIPPH